MTTITNLRRTNGGITYYEEDGEIFEITQNALGKPAVIQSRRGKWVEEKSVFSYDSKGRFLGMVGDIETTLLPALIAEATGTATYETNPLTGGITSLVAGGLPIKGASIAPSIGTRTSWRIANAGLQNIDTFVGLGYNSSTKYLSALVGGTYGRIFMPWLSRRNARMSATIKITKSTASSASLFGLAFAASGSDPGGSYTGAEVGYVQGQGLVIYRNNAVDTILVADASLTDGVEYDVSLFIDDFWTPNTSASAQYQISVRVIDSTGADVAAGSMAKNRSFDPVRGVLVARTNVAAGGIKNLAISQNAAGAVNVPGIVYGHLYGTSAANDLFFMRIPALPNGKLIIALHGRGLSLFQMAYLSAQFPPVWQELERLGYTILFPNLGGDTWASSSSMLLLKQLKESVCSEFRLDPCVYLWGYSMGGMVALSAAQKSTFGDGNVAAIYLAAPVCDLEAVLAANPSFTEISTIYPLASDRVAANPIKQSVANFAAMPVVFVGATDDATVSKVQNADAMSALLAPITTTSVISTTGGHGSANQFRALDSVGTFQLNQ